QHVLVHVAPRHPPGSQATGDGGGEVRQRGEREHPHGRPAEPRRARPLGRPAPRLRLRAIRGADRALATADRGAHELTLAGGPRRRPGARPARTKGVRRGGQQHRRQVAHDRHDDKLIGQRGHYPALPTSCASRASRASVTSRTSAAHSSAKPGQSPRGNPPASDTSPAPPPASPAPARRDRTRPRRPVRVSTRPTSSSTTLTSTIGSPGSYRTESATHRSVPRNSSVVPSSRVHTSPTRSSFASPTCARCPFSI